MIVAGTNTTTVSLVRYGLWRKCRIGPNGEDITLNGITKTKHCENLMDEGTTGKVTDTPRRICFMYSGL